MPRPARAFSIPPPKVGSKSSVRRTVTSAIRSSSGAQHRRSSNPTPAQPGEGVICVTKGELLDLGPDAGLARQRQELLAVATGEVRDRADLALSPQVGVGERRDVAHV